MSHRESNLRSLLSPTKSGTLFAPFRSRSANPDGFDSKMKLWIAAIEEWAVVNRKLTLSLKDIHHIFVSDAGIRPDKECIRLVLSEMKRRSKIVPSNNLKSSKCWTTSNSHSVIDNFVDPKGWLSWGVKNFVLNPATWAVTSLTTTDNQHYSDLTDMSITDTMKFTCLKSLDELANNLYHELVRICKAEKQVCFEWQHLLELTMPIISTIIDATDGRELSEIIDVLIEFLALRKRVAIKNDNDTKLVKVAIDDTSDDDVTITKKDIAIARLLRAKELLTADADRYHNQALRAKQEALDCYSKKEIARAKSQLRSHKRLMTCADQKEAQLTNVEIMLDQLENTNSNLVILQAYKDGAEALKIANTQLDNNTSVLDDLYDATAEAQQLNEEMNRMLRDISCVSQGVHNTTDSDLEAELNRYISQEGPSLQEKPISDKDNAASARESKQAAIDELEAKLNDLEVCRDPIEHNLNETSDEIRIESTPKKVAASSVAT